MKNDLVISLNYEALTTLSAFVRLGRLHALPETPMAVIDTIQTALDQMMLAMLRERRAGTIVRADLVDRFLDDVVTGDSDVIRFVHPDSVREIVRLFAAFTVKYQPALTALCGDCGLWRQAGQPHPSEALIEARAEIDVDNQLLAEDKRLLDLFECPVHGTRCIPHAIEEVQKLRAIRPSLKQFVAELEIALDLETHAGTDPAAWIEGVITKLKGLL